VKERLGLYIKREQIGEPVFVKRVADLVVLLKMETSVSDDRIARGVCPSITARPSLYHNPTSRPPVSGAAAMHPCVLKR